MAQKAFFYEAIGGLMHKCMFAGLDKDGQPQWLMVDQGAEVMVLSEYQEGVIDGEEINMLCLEGEKVESTTMALLLGAVLQSYGPDIPGMLHATLEALKRWNVAWRRDPQKMEVHLLEYLDSVKEKKCFRFYITCTGLGFVTEADAFDNIDDMMEFLHHYFDALTFEAGIPVISKGLVAANDLLARVSNVDKEMFDYTDGRE